MKIFGGLLPAIDVVFDASPVFNEGTRMIMAAPLKDGGRFVSVQLPHAFSDEFLGILITKKNAGAKMIRRELDIAQSLSDIAKLIEAGKVIIVINKVYPMGAGTGTQHWKPNTFGAKSCWRSEKKTNHVMKRIKTISEFHQFRQLPPPEHPLLSVTEINMVKRTVDTTSMNWCYDFYAIGMKRASFSNTINFRYGQQPFDFNEGILSFVAPNQVLSLSVTPNRKQHSRDGYCLSIDFMEYFTG